MRGFWLRSSSLCSLTLALDLELATCTMSVYLKVYSLGECIAVVHMTPQSLLLATKTDFGFENSLRACAGPAALAVRPQCQNGAVLPPDTSGHTAGLGAGSSSE